MKYFLILLVVFLPFSRLSSQSIEKDSVGVYSLAVKSILPVAMIGAGFLISNSEFEKKSQETIRNGVGNDFHCKIDDYAQYVPIAEMYIADMIGVESKNHWFDQTKYLFISNFISAIITHGMKNTISKSRPTGSPNSFPSGHTSLAFTNATVLYNEFSGSSPLLAYSGYAFATTTATFRVLNNEHWISDVLVGAGIGIFVTNIVYYIEPFKDFNPFKNTKRITFVPVIDRDNYGVYMSYNL